MKPLYFFLCFYDLLTSFTQFDTNLLQFFFKETNLFTRHFIIVIWYIFAIYFLHLKIDVLFTIFFISNYFSILQYKIYYFFHWHTLIYCISIVLFFHKL